MKWASCFIIVLALLVSSCGEEPSQSPSTPHKLTSDAMGHYCGMTLTEHDGPKGQIILTSRSEPVWFSSARDAFSFTMLAEEAKDIRAIYVSDMAKAPSWNAPGENWVDARQAFFVIGSSKQGGMGAPETVPFSDRTAADRFAGQYGGKVVTFTEVPQDYVLSSETSGQSSAGAGHTHHDAGPAGGNR